ncbi:multidrug effflux MFS transporter [Vibrio sp. MA40-2]|uniref:multidrug effflux MFS transporter n=1 Tax=Vibrio sp. MA40-2 TaxID=3391828 RepID=UPI0039A4237B
MPTNHNSTKYQIVLLVLLVLFAPLAIDIYLPALPMISDTFHVEHSMAQDTVTWFLFTMGVGQLFAGPLADKLGRKKIALAGIFIYGISAHLAWLASSIEWLLAARLLQGFGACATSVAAFATVRDIFGAHKSGRMISYLNGAICFVPALAPILGSYLTQHFGWRSNFSFMTVFSVAIGILLFFAMKETNPAQEKTNVFKLSRYGAVISNQNFIYHASLCMLAMSVILAYVTNAPIVLMDQMGLSMDTFTFWFAVNAAINIAAALLAPKLMDKGTHKALIIGIVTMIVGGGLMIILPSDQYAWAFMIPIFLSSIGFALVLGTAAGKALSPFGDKAGTAAALLGLFQMSGAGLVVGIVHRLDLTAQSTISLHMFLIAPSLLILLTNKGREWHKVYS